MLRPALWGEDLFDSVFDNFFEDFMRPVRFRQLHTPQTASLMRTDVKENGSDYELDVELPGYKKEDVKAQLKDGVLTISAETNSDTEDKDADGRFLRRERRYGACSRSFYVGDNLTQEDIKAKFENGILKLTVPKKEIAPAVEENRYIAIEG